MIITEFILLEFPLNYILWRNCCHKSFNLSNALCISGKKIVPFKQIQQFKDSASNQERGLSGLYIIEYLYAVTSIVADLHAGMHAALNMNGNVV